MRMKTAKIKVTIYVLLGLVLSIQTARLVIQVRQKRIALAHHQAKCKGNPRASLKIVEYTDFQCPACAKGMKVLKEYGLYYPERFYVEYKHFPLEMHPKAMSIAIAAECAAQQKKFWPFHDLAFERQNLLRESINLFDRLKEIAGATGLNQQVFDRCLEDPKIKEAISREIDEGRRLKVGATPTYFINEKMVVGGNSLKQELEKAVGKLP